MSTRFLLLVLLPLALAASESEQSPSPHLPVALPAGLRAELARLPSAAKARAEQHLSRARVALDADEAIHVDTSGELYYACAALPAAAIAAAVPLSGGALVPVAQVPRLHSRPGCARIIHLDFTGHVVTGSAWNASMGIPRWDALAYDRDGDPTTFSSGELAAIRQIWERVAEDFAPFDVDVSTEEVAEGPQVMRVLITRDSDAADRDCPGKGGGGIAYIGVWGNPEAARYAPAWVYANRLGSGREDYVAEACSHEAGHILGLHHDGTASATYYGGQGAGEVSWAPIMGVAYGANVTQWSQGSYPDANQHEDDVAIIADCLGWREDDHAGRGSLATALLPDPSGVITASGVIARRGDVDAFVVAVGAGSFAITASPYRAANYTRGGNVDLRLEVRDAAGVVVASAAPTTSTTASVALTLPAGRYLVAVAGQGAPGVFDDYASMGAYTLSGRVVPTPADGVAPAAIADLAAVEAGSGVVDLRWTASGDDDRSGTAALYALRISSAPIVDEQTWDGADVVPCTLAPAAAGSRESMRLGGFPAQARRWIALRAIDEVGNQGAIAAIAIATPPPALAIGDATVTPAAAGLLAAFVVTCSPASGAETRVAWSTHDETAFAPTDYTAASGTLVFPAGQTTATVLIAASGGRSVPARLRVELSAAVGADLAVSTAVADLPAGSAIANRPPNIPAAQPTPLAAGGGGGGCGMGSALALLAMAGACSAGWNGRRRS